MNRSIWVKAIAVLLCALSLVAVAGSAGAIILLDSFNLYTATPEAYRALQMESIASEAARLAADRYNASQVSDLPPELWEDADFRYELLREYSYPSQYLMEGLIHYTISSMSGETLDSSYTEPEEVAAGYTRYAVTTGSTACAATLAAVNGETVEDSPTYSAAELMGDGDYLYTNMVRVETAVGTNTYQVRYYQGPAYQVTVWIAPGVWFYDADDGWQLANLVYPVRNQLFVLLPVGLLAFLAGLVYLGWAAGRKPHSDEIIPTGFNRLPLDLYLCGAGVSVFFIGLLAVVLLAAAYDGGQVMPGFVVLAGMLLLLAGMVCVCYYCAVAAQVKMKDGYWWRHSVLGGCLRKLYHLLAGTVRGLVRVVSMLPLIWQLVLMGSGAGLLLIIGAYMSWYSSPVPLMMAITVFGGVLCYGAYAFGTLYTGVQRMSQGDLTRKVPTKYLWGSLLDFANRLNALADVAVLAARNQLRSERMKTELITNVSHDIKTPLTSIISYVDLLRKPHTEAEGNTYLEVLSRQSLRMKKLIEDLMELSKASTGNIQADIQRLDAAETVNQALGEFADKLAQANLTPVFPQPEAPIAMMADGRLAWRVLSNLLSNAVKYSLPGTRLYVDLRQVEDSVVLSLKNISRDPLNITAGELMERFVRGDDARNTEGSGLGLNIAQSLMELQQGRLQLLVDGDLFKVTVIFPAG